MGTLDDLVTRLASRSWQSRDAAFAEMRTRIATEAPSPENIAAMVALAEKWPGKHPTRNSWRDVVELLVTLRAQDLVPVLVDAMAAIDYPWKNEPVIYQKNLAARALIALVPDRAAGLLAPWLGDVRVLLGRPQPDDRTTLDRIVELGPRAAAAVPAIQRWANGGLEEAKQALVHLAVAPAPIDPLDPHVAAIVTKLGGTIAPYDPHCAEEPGIPAAIRRFGRDIAWPEHTFANKEVTKGGYVWVWGVQWHDLHVDTETFDFGGPWQPRTASIANADGGNYQLHVVLDGRDPFNPPVFKTDHDSRDSKVHTTIPLLDFLRTLKKEKPARMT